MMDEDLDSELAELMRQDTNKRVLKIELDAAVVMRDIARRHARMETILYRTDLAFVAFYWAIGLFYIVMIALGSPWYNVFYSAVWVGLSFLFIWTARRHRRARQDYESAIASWTETIAMKAERYEQLK